MAPPPHMLLKMQTRGFQVSQLFQCTTVCQRNIAKFVLRILFEDLLREGPNIRIALLTGRNLCGTPECLQISWIFFECTLIRRVGSIELSSFAQSITPLNELMGVADLLGRRLESNEFPPARPFAQKCRCWIFTR